MSFTSKTKLFRKLQGLRSSWPGWPSTFTLGDFASFAWQELPEISCNPVFLRLSFFHDLHLQTPSSDFYDLKDCPSFQFCRTMVTRSCAATQARAEWSWPVALRPCWDRMPKSDDKTPLLHIIRVMFERLDRFKGDIVLRQKDRNDRKIQADSGSKLFAPLDLCRGTSSWELADNQMHCFLCMNAL